MSVLRYRACGEEGGGDTPSLRQYGYVPHLNAPIFPSLISSKVTTFTVLSALKAHLQFDQLYRHNFYSPISIEKV